MMVGRDGFRAVAGGPVRHIPVLARAALDFLAVRDGGTYIDATFGAGGHTRLILAAANCRVVGIDRDQSAIAAGADLVEEAGGRLTLVEERFSRLEHVARDLGIDAADGVLVDLGVSSMQLEEAARGFSFRADGPLDMRMGRSGPTAADVVASASERDLAVIIATLGEERRARAVARAIVAARASEPIRTTDALAAIVSRVVRAHPQDIHPATRTFQALRMFVNDELGELDAALRGSERLLRPGGRLVVISFHSLEDRIVKTFMAARSGGRGTSRHAPLAHRPAATLRRLTPRPVVPDEAEVRDNPRARSAKLRAAERTDAPAVDPGESLVPPLPALADVARGR